jgi:hypothetical protein
MLAPFADLGFREYPEEDSPILKLRLLPEQTFNAGASARVFKVETAWSVA